jgi:anti-sigma B factor antagonist
MLTITPDQVPPAPLFSCDVRPARHAVVVAPAGELDLATVPHVRDALAELHHAGFTHVVLDLGAVDFLDSSALALLAFTDRTAARDGHRFSLVVGDGPVRRTLELSGLLDQLDLLPRSPA